jgi:hypothetical protein
MASWRDRTSETQTGRQRSVCTWGLGDRNRLCARWAPMAEDRLLLLDERAAYVEEQRLRRPEKYRPPEGSEKHSNVDIGPLASKLGKGRRRVPSFIISFQS